MVRRRNGFTLVELLVVIGIIALLIAILLPALNKARKEAQEIVCMSNLRQFGFGIQMYADQNQGELPQKGPDGSDQGANDFGKPQSGVIGFDDPSLWFNAIPPFCGKKSYYQQLVDDYNGVLPAPYAGGANSIFICPTAGQAAALPGQDVVLGNYYLLYGTDSTGYLKNSTGLQHVGQFKFDMSYVWNSKLTTTINGGAEKALKISECRPGSDVVVMTEKLANFGEYQDKVCQQYNAEYPGAYNGGEIIPEGFGSNVAQSKADWRRFTTRHRSGGMLLFADGHVSWFAWTDAQIQAAQMPYNPNFSDANQPGKMIWGALGAVN